MKVSKILAGIAILMMISGPAFAGKAGPGHGDTGETGRDFGSAVSSQAQDDGKGLADHASGGRSSRD